MTSKSNKKVFVFITFFLVILGIQVTALFILLIFTPLLFIGNLFISFIKNLLIWTRQLFYWMWYDFDLWLQRFEWYKKWVAKVKMINGKRGYVYLYVSTVCFVMGYIALSSDATAIGNLFFLIAIFALGGRFRTATMEWLRSFGKKMRIVSSIVLFFFFVFYISKLAIHYGQDELLIWVSKEDQIVVEDLVERIRMREQIDYQIKIVTMDTEELIRRIEKGERLRTDLFVAKSSDYRWFAQKEVILPNVPQKIYRSTFDVKNDYEGKLYGYLITRELSIFVCAHSDDVHLANQFSSDANYEYLINKF